MKVHYPLVFSTLFMRIGAGAIVVQVLSNWLWRSTPDWPIALFALVAIALGGMLSLAHLGRPKRILNSFSNMRSSMLTWEAIVNPPLLLVLAVFHFLVPFLVLIPRAAKTEPRRLACVAAIMLLIALPPPPPTPTTRIFAPRSRPLSSSITGCSSYVE